MNNRTEQAISPIGSTDAFSLKAVEKGQQAFHEDVILTLNELNRRYPPHGLAHHSDPGRTHTDPLFNLFMNRYIKEIATSWKDKEEEDLGIGTRYDLFDKEKGRFWRISIWQNDGHSVEFMTPQTPEETIAQLNDPLLSHMSTVAEQYYRDQQETHYQRYPRTPSYPTSGTIFSG